MSHRVLVGDERESLCNRHGFPRTAHTSHLSRAPSRKRCHGYRCALIGNTTAHVVHTHTMSGKKKLSAFSVYSEQRSQQKDEEDVRKISKITIISYVDAVQGATVCVGMSSGSGEDVSGEGVREGVVSREGVREGVGSREGVREGVGSREGVGMARKRKKKAKLRALLKKRRRLEGQRVGHVK